MLDLDLFRVYTDRLNRLGVVYMVIGSVAVIVYGEPRLTHDIDIVVRLTVDDIPSIEKTFPPESFYIPPTRTLKMESRRDIRGRFSLIHHETGFKADIYLEGRDPLHLWAIEKRRRVAFGDAELWVAPPEYVVIRKLEFYQEGKSPKHLRDIENMLASISSAGIHEIEQRLPSSTLEVFRSLRRQA